MNYADLCNGFQDLKAEEKARFIDARLEWATNGGLIAEMTARLNIVEKHGLEEEGGNHECD